MEWISWMAGLRKTRVAAFTPFAAVGNWNWRVLIGRLNFTSFSGLDRWVSEGIVLSTLTMISISRLVATHSCFGWSRNSRVLSSRAPGLSIDFL